MNALSEWKRSSCFEAIAKAQWYRLAFARPLVFYVYLLKPADERGGIVGSNHFDPIRMTINFT